jgi:hypothetical protein
VGKRVSGNRGALFFVAFQRCELADKKERIVAAQAKARHDANGGDKKSEAAKSDVAKLPPPIPPDDRKTRTILAEEAGVSPRTYDAAKKVMKNATEKVKQLARDGDVKIHAASKLATLSPETQDEIAEAEPEERKALIKAAASLATPVEVMDEMEEIAVAVVDPIFNGCDEAARADARGAVHIICVEAIHAVGRWCPGSMKGIRLMSNEDFNECMNQIGAVHAALSKWQTALEKERAKTW